MPTLTASRSVSTAVHVDGAGGHLAQKCFEFGEGIFDRVEVRRIGWEILKSGTSRLDRTSDIGAFVSWQVVHDDGVALP